MAMDKNDLVRLLNKVPKTADRHEIDTEDQIDFLDAQILERKKVLYRFKVQIETAIAFANLDDKAAVELAEQRIKEAAEYIKPLIWELDSLLTQRKALS